MKKCGMYNDEVKEWRQKDPANQTWPNLKTHFSNAYFEMKEDNDMGMKAPGFHAANVAERQEEHQALVADALNNLANVVTADSKAFSDLTEANASLAKQLKEAQNMNKN